MYRQTFNYEDEQAAAQFSYTKKDNVYNEFYTYVHLHNCENEPFSNQLKRLSCVFGKIRQESLLQNASPVFLRFYLSDAANEAAPLKEMLAGFDFPCAISIIEQPPLDGSKVALLAYFVSSIRIRKGQDFISFSPADGLEHYWWCGPQIPECSSEHQTRMLFEMYEEALRRHQMSVKDNCIRTWFYVQNIDVNYAGMSRARNEFFAQHGLTADTHYIASTGIQGRSADYHVTVRMDGYAVKGLDESRIQYLDAREYLSPTRIYNVTFERGVCLHLADRLKCYISGTASIDKDGNVLYLGDVVKQTERALLNVEKLLEEGNSSLDDLAFLTVYLRDVSDTPSVRRLLTKRLPGVPLLIVYAPVCRPTWLIEMECITIK